MPNTNTTSAAATVATETREIVEEIRLRRAATPVVPETPQVLPPMPSNAIPSRLVDALRWAPTYHARKMAITLMFNKGSEAYLMCAKFLCDAYDKKDWKHDGSGAQNFYQWVENELTQKMSNVKKMISVWRGLSHLIEAHQEILTQIEFSKLVEIVPHLKGLEEEQQVELIHMAGTNSVRDLRNNIREMTGNGVATDTCGHTGVMEAWFKCPDCGKFMRVSDYAERGAEVECVGSSTSN